MNIKLEINLYSFFNLKRRLGIKNVRKTNPYIDKLAAVTSENLNTKYKQQLNKNGLYKLLEIIFSLSSVLGNLNKTIIPNKIINLEIVLKSNILTVSKLK